MCASRIYASLTLALMVALATTYMPSVYAKLPNKTLIYCSEDSPQGFDANQFVTVVDATANAETLYNRLVEFEHGGTKIVPSLAERWDISPNGRVYTFHLRRGVKFHTTSWFKPTREFNADDVQFTFERMRDPKMPFRRADPTEFPYWNYIGFDKLIAKIEAPDPYTVRFTLNTTHAPFLAKMAVPSLSILSAEYAAQLLKSGKSTDINWKPVGTGRFVFRKYVKDAKIVFDGNPDYWKPAEVQLSQLIFSITPNAAVRVQKLKVNECQVISARSTNTSKLERHPNIRVLSQPGLEMDYLVYNVMHKPLDDVRVRRALDIAIDKSSIIQAVYGGRAQIAVAPMPPAQWSYDQNLKDAPRDLVKAKALLAKAGYPNGFTLSLMSRPNATLNSQLTAEIIQQDWAKIGVKAEIVTYERGQYLKYAISGKHDTMLSNWLSYLNDPGYWLSLLSSKETSGGYNFSKWCYPSFDDLIQRAVQTMDVAERTRLYTQAQRIFKREQPFTPIAYPIIYQPISKNVTGFKINPFGPTQFAGVSLK